MTPEATICFQVYVISVISVFSSNFLHLGSSTLSGKRNFSPAPTWRYGTCVGSGEDLVECRIVGR